MDFKRLGISGVALIGIVSVSLLAAALGFVLLRSPAVAGVNFYDQVAAIAAKTWHEASGTREVKLLYSVSTSTGRRADYRNEAVAVVSSSSKSEAADAKYEDSKKPVEKSNLNDCSFEKVKQVNNSVRLNEISWMGTKNSATDEWIELRNMLPNDISLDGWKLFSENGKFEVQFGAADILRAGRYFIMERTDDKTLPNIDADRIYSGSLPNSDIHLRLVDRFCGLVDEVDASPNWPAGDSIQRKTMERNYPGSGWHTSDEVGGSPKRENSELPSEPRPQILAVQVIPEAVGEESSSSIPTSSLASKGRIFITEVMAGKAEESAYEFVELMNFEDFEVDLTGWNIKKKSSTGSESALVSSSRFDGIKMRPGSHLLLANPKYTGSVAADIVWPSSYTLADKNNAVVVYGKEGERVDEVAWAEIPRDSSYARLENGVFEAGAPDPQNSSN